ncbi:MAG: protoporphyrinogen oxidase [Actinomycetota bacterium]|nr:protoporphyrinogen oxidase [Actinomycetota bacterium]
MRVAIIGGGIAGLAAAQALAKARPDIEIVVLEGSDHIGGKLVLGSVGGLTVDFGAESILARRPEATELIAEVGLGDKLVHPATISAGIWTHGAVRPMPPTVMGIPSDLDALEASGIVAERPLSLEIPRLPGDMAVAEFIAERVGSDIVDRLVEPLLGGVYAGHAAELSLDAAAPQIAALGDDLLAGATRARAAAVASGPVFAGLVGGIGQLPDAVARASGAEIRTNAAVRQLTRSDDGWELVVGPTTAIEVINADAVIVAAPAPAAARLLSGAAPEAAFALAAIQYASMAIVTFAMPRSTFPRAPEGSGFLVPPIDGKSIKAVTYSSNKWEWVGREAGEERVIFRSSIGRAGETALLQRDDAELIELALTDLREAVGLTGDPIDAVVTRWGGGLPQYTVGHLDRVATIDADIATVPGLEVCGAAYRGVGIPAVIASAQGAADRLLDDLATMTP